jgi:hypothetical protein
MQRYYVAGNLAGGLKELRPRAKYSQKRGRVSKLNRRY